VSEETNSNGSSGRFNRMETKLDLLADDLNKFRVDVITRLANLEATAKAREVNEAQRVSKSSYKWMKFGVGATFIVGAITLALRLAGI
jgi:hypothetical protein